MSGTIGSVLTSVGNYLDVFKANATIDDIVPDVTFSTYHRDDLAITRHPVEQGAAITDHAYKEQPEVEIRIGFSDTGGYSGSLLQGTAAIKTIGYANQVYNKLIALQASRRLINVSTGKRMYRNCLIAGVSTETAEGFVFSCIVSLRIREIQIVSLSVSNVPDRVLQTQPQKTDDTTEGGTTNPTPTSPSTNQSIFSRVLGIFGISSSSPDAAPAAGPTVSVPGRNVAVQGY